MRITANITADNSLYNIQQGRAKLDKISEQLSSYQIINRPSDDPINTRLLLDIGDKIKVTDQYTSNISKASTWQQITNTALTGMSDTMALAKQQIATISSGSSDATIRQNAVSQLQALKQQMVDMGNTQMGGQYIFGGASNATPPFMSKSGDLTTSVLGDSTVSNVDVTGLKVGMQVSGAGIPAGTVIEVVDANSFTLVDSSKPPIPVNVSALSILKSGDLTNGSSTVSNAVVTGLSAGMRVSGADIPGGTVIGSVGVNSFTLVDSSKPPIPVNATGTTKGSSLTIYTSTSLNFYNGDSTQSSVEIAQGSPQALNVTGDRLLKGTRSNPSYGATDIFKAFDDLITAVNANDVPGITAGSQALENGAQQINNAVSDVASRLSRLDSMTKLNTNTRNTLLTVYSNTQDADIAKLGVELSNQTTAFNASLSATAKISQMSLLDYMT